MAGQPLQAGPADGPIRVGRGGDCDIVLDDPSVARRHLEIRWADGGKAAVIRDLSAGDTLQLVNGRWKPVPETPIGLDTPLLLGTWQTSVRELRGLLVKSSPVPEPESAPEPKPEPKLAPPPLPVPVPAPAPVSTPVSTPAPAPVRDATFADPDLPRPRLVGGGAAPVTTESEAHRALGGDAVLIMRYDANKKTALIAYILWFFLGTWGAHRFYMGKIGSGAGMLCAMLAGIVLTFVAVGVLVIIGVYVWWIVDAFLIPGWARAQNNALIDRLNAGEAP